MAENRREQLTQHLVLPTLGTSLGTATRPWTHDGSWTQWRLGSRRLGSKIFLGTLRRSV